MYRRIMLAAWALMTATAVAGCSGTHKAPVVSGTGRTATSAGPDSPGGSTSTPTPVTSPGSPSTTQGPGPTGPEVNPSGDIPDNQAFVDFGFPGGGFAIKVPEGWARTEADGTVSFTDKLNRITMEKLAVPSAPTVASAQATEVPAVKAAAQHYEPGKATMVARAAGPAVLITYRADAAADPVTAKVVHDDVERYEFWRSGTEVVLTLSAPVGADNVDPWRTVTDSLRWTA